MQWRQYFVFVGCLLFFSFLFTGTRFHQWLLWHTATLVKQHCAAAGWESLLEWAWNLPATEQVQGWILQLPEGLQGPGYWVLWCLGDGLIIWTALSRKSRLWMCWGGSTSPHCRRAGMSWRQRTALLADCSWANSGKPQTENQPECDVGWTKAALSWAGPEPPAAQAQLSAAQSWASRNAVPSTALLMLLLSWTVVTTD